MSVVQEGTVIRLEGPCRVEDAEALAVALQRMPGSTVDLTHCEAMHAAVAQALLAFGPPMVGIPAESFLQDFLIPALGGKRQP